MSTEVTAKKYLGNEDYFAALAGEAATMTGGAGGKAFLKFSGDDGEYVYGSDDKELPLGSQLAVNMLSFKRGWVIWKDSKVVHEIMTGVEEPVPSQASLPYHGPYLKSEGPSEQQTIEFATTEEPFIEMVFQANNISKRRAMTALLKNWGATYKMNPGKTPIIEIDEVPFEIKAEGRKATKHAPVFKIVAWVSDDEIQSMKGENPADYQASAPEAGQAEHARLEAPAKAAIPAPAAKPRAARGRF